MEITDWDAEQNAHTDKDWHIGQFTIFEAEGMDFADLLRSEWDKFTIKEIQKEQKNKHKVDIER